VLLAPITAKIACMHTATWMPGKFFITKPNKLFPLTIKLIDKHVIVSGSYISKQEVPIGSILLAINEKPIANIIEQLRSMTSADALNTHFIDSRFTKRFSRLYASVYGRPDEYEIEYLSPGSN